MQNDRVKPLNGTCSGWSIKMPAVAQWTSVPRGQQAGKVLSRIPRLHERTGWSKIGVATHGELVGGVVTARNVRQSGFVRVLCVLDNVHRPSKHLWSHCAQLVAENCVRWCFGCAKSESEASQGKQQGMRGQPAKIWFSATQPNAGVCKT